MKSIKYEYPLFLLKVKYLPLHPVLKQHIYILLLRGETKFHTNKKQVKLQLPL
jgi:hypothetical protein